MMSERPGVMEPGHAQADSSTMEGWVASLDRLFPLPADYRDESIDRRGALELLRCNDRMLTQLVERGLPCSTTSDGERFDRHDLFNLALYSGSGRSVPERAFQYAVRWMAAPTRTFFKPRLWSFEIELSCGRHGRCGDVPRFSIARPCPELFGGRTHRLTSTPEVNLTGTAIEANSASLGVSALVETRGERRSIRSRQVREILAEFDDANLRWVKIPEPLQRRPDYVLLHGAATCVAASIDIDRRCRAAGLDSRTRRGWVMGMLDLVHAWVEVVDEDGEVKIIDPIFTLLSSLGSSPNPEFADLCKGSVINRILPCDYSAEAPVEGHFCGGGEAGVTKKTTILPVRAAEAV